MAKAKKKESLTPEERLQAALVPESEQPYPVPRNWCWTQLGTYIDFATDYVANGSFASLKQNVAYYKEENYAILVKTQDFSNSFTEDITYTDKRGYDFLKKSVLYGGELILSNIGSIGKVFRVPHLNKPMTLAPNSIMIKCHRDIDYDLLYYYFLSPFGTEQLYSITTGTAVKKFNKTDLKTICLPLPPLPEQQRIVDRIDCLFAKLDEAKQKAQDALDSFENRKAAILHKAFTGELTAQWRKEHGVGMESWEKANLGKYVDSQYGYTESASQEQVGPKFLRITDIQDGVVNWANVPFCKISDTDFERYAVSQNDIMIARTGATTGKSYLIVDDVTAVFASYLIRIKIKSPKLQPQYLYGFMQSQMYWGQITEFSAGIAQPGVNAKKLKEIILPIPFVPEQVEIVRIIDALLAKEQQAKEAAEGVLEQIDLMKKAILARAFRGELGTNDPREESAAELVKTII